MTQEQFMQKSFLPRLHISMLFVGALLAFTVNAHSTGLPPAAIKHRTPITATSCFKPNSKTPHKNEKTNPTPDRGGVAAVTPCSRCHRYLEGRLRHAARPAKIHLHA